MYGSCGETIVHQNMMERRSVPTETIVNPPKELTIGTPAMIYWSHGKKIFWKDDIAPSKANQDKTITKFNTIQCTGTTLQQFNNNTNVDIILYIYISAA